MMNTGEIPQLLWRDTDVGAGEVRVEGLENTQVQSLTLGKRGQKSF